MATRTTRAFNRFQVRQPEACGSLVIEEQDTGDGGGTQPPDDGGGTQPGDGFPGGQDQQTLLFAGAGVAVLIILLLAVGG